MREPGAIVPQHLVQFFGRDRERLALNAGEFLAEGLASGGAGLVVADEANRTSIRRRIQEQTQSVALAERLIFLDGAVTLDQFMRDGAPDAELFAATVGAVAKKLRERFGRLRAYGEMVGRLWSRREYSAAIALESLWNNLMHVMEFDLYCGYPIDVLGDGFQLAAVRPLLRAHDRVVPAVRGSFHEAIARAMDEVLGDSPRGLTALARGALSDLPSSLPPVEGLMLRLRSALPRYADEIVARAVAYA